MRDPNISPIPDPTAKPAKTSPSNRGIRFMGGIILLAFLFVIIAFLIAVIAAMEGEYIGAGLIMIAASLPISAGVSKIL
ncbi:MAG: hypothetical protein AAFR61_28430 [Bacteroidota bacterium]